MGLLDDAIREHLELRRKHGADEHELERQETEALAPVRREVPAAPAPEEEPDFLPEGGFRDGSVEDREPFPDEQETMVAPPFEADPGVDLGPGRGDDDLPFEEAEADEFEPEQEPELGWLADGPPAVEPEPREDEPAVEGDLIADEELAASDDPELSEELPFEEDEEEGFEPEPEAGPARRGDPGLEEEPEAEPGAPGPPLDDEALPLEEPGLFEETDFSPHEEPEPPVEDPLLLTDEPVVEEEEVSEAEAGSPPPDPERRSKAGGNSRVVPDFEDGDRPGGIDTPAGTPHDLDFDE